MCVCVSVERDKMTARPVDWRTPLNVHVDDVSLFVCLHGLLQSTPTARLTSRLTAAEPCGGGFLYSR